VVNLFFRSLLAAPAPYRCEQGIHRSDAVLGREGLSITAGSYALCVAEDPLMGETGKHWLKSNIFAETLGSEMFPLFSQKSVVVSVFPLFWRSGTGWSSGM